MDEDIKNKINAMADLWKAFLYIIEDKEFDKELYSWGKLLVYSYDTKVKNGFSGNECDFIYEFYSKLNTNKEFAEAIQKLYRTILTNTLIS